MKRKIILLATFIAMFTAIATAQEPVTNIRFTQNDKMVSIRYDLNVRSFVKLLISIDDGVTYTDTMTINGNVNTIVQPSKNLYIRWQAFKDLGYGDYPEIRLKFITEEKPLDNKPAKKQKTQPYVRNQQHRKDDEKMKTFATLNVGYTNSGIPSAGFTVGQYNKFGWFVTLMTGFDFDYTGYDIVDYSKEDGYIGNILPFYNPESKITAVSGMIGGIARLNDMIYVKAGIGYGMRSVAWQLWEGTYVTNNGFSAHGVDVSAGFLFDINRFIITVDGVTTNFHVFEARLGLGFRFTK